MKFVKRYRLFLILMAVLISLLFINQELGKKAFGITTFSLKEMLVVIPPVFVLLGLLDVWVPKETMVKYMGEDSGIFGIILAFLIGSAAAGPLYGAFPVAGVFLKKGAKLSNVFIFIGAWSTTKIPMFLFEISSMGLKFALTRLIINIPIIIIIATLLGRSVTHKEKEGIYELSRVRSF